MNSDGYLKLIDFGAAKILNDYSYSIVGTPYYISPEVLSGKEYNVSCDYWSAGICLYEMMYGMYPFGNYCRSIVEVYKEIKENKVIFPVEKDHSKYKLINKLIMELLEKQPLARPCSFKMLKNHQLFSGFQWGKLLNLKLKPPYIPKKFEWNNYNDLSTKYENTINKTLSENDLNVYGDKHLRRDWAEEF
jgi:cGMP-dependent protein kinase